MATYYIDFEGGNDANAGTSFATRWKTITNGATAARIAPGDTIRIMASPDPTSIGNATWTGGGRPAAINISSSTNATPIVITTASAHGLVAGDYVSIASHSTNTNANGIWKVGTVPNSTSFQILQINGNNTTGNGTGGATGTVTNVDNCIVKTATPLVQNIALCGGLGQKPAWTPSTNVTATNPTSLSREGSGIAQIGVQSLFTTGKAAYYTLPATLDLSGYQQVSFWAQFSIGTVGAAGQAYLALCSDTAGNTVVHQCNIPNLGALGVWVPVTVDLGTNLSTTINSVALYIATDVGAQTINLDNIIACKAASAADSVTLQSLISKSDGTGNEAWYAIQSINHDAIMLTNGNTLTPTNISQRGYSGATETVTTYKRETVKVNVSTTQDAAGNGTITASGTAGNPITFSGGWSRTDMSTQTGRTWLDGQNTYGRGINVVAQNYVTIDKLDCCRFYRGILFSASGTAQDGLVLTSAYATANNAHGVIFTGFASNSFSAPNLWSNNNIGTGLSFGATNFPALGLSVGNVYALNNASDGVLFDQSADCYVSNLTAINNGPGSNGGNLNFSSSTNCSVGNLSASNSNNSSGIRAANSLNCYVNGGSTSNNGFAAVYAANSTSLYLNNFTINESTETILSAGQAYIYSNRHDNTDGNNWIWAATYGTINQQTAVVDAPATTAWKIVPSANGLATPTSPVRLKLGTVVCGAGGLVTVTARMRRTNTAMTMQLACPGGQIAGVSSTVAASMTAAANTWETVTITFTPTKAGGVDIYAYAFGGTTFSGYVCNLTAAQA